MLFCSLSLGQMLVLLADMAELMENYNVFPRAHAISDSTLLSSRSSIMPLIMISQEITVKQVNYAFGIWFFLCVQPTAASGHCPCEYSTRVAT